MDFLHMFVYAYLYTVHVFTSLRMRSSMYIQLSNTSLGEVEVQLAYQVALEDPPLVSVSPSSGRWWNSPLDFL